MNQPNSINSLTPFVSKAREYVEKGWGVLPLPEKRKEYPPTGFTGRAGKFADEDDLINWLSDAKFKNGNIALRVGNMLVVEGIRYEVIGIDVDAYKGKQGAKELAALEKKFGKLPDTWIVTSRSDGISGIRFFLVPYGYGFRGKASDSIEIIQRVHRYAVTFPSVHPDTGGQYWWYAPGFEPDGVGIAAEIPVASELPLLPDPWIDFLTDDRRDDAEGQYGIDLDSSEDDLKAWIKTNFNDLSNQCPKMKRAVSQHISDIEGSSTNHDKITKAHWNLISLATEGHSGVVEAIKEIESVYIKDILAKGKRSEGMARKEVLRSRWGTFRKIKAKADTFAAQGLSIFSQETCMDAAALAGDDDKGNGWVYDVEVDFSFDPSGFDKNDLSQAKHFIARVGDNVRYIQDYNGWIIYDGKTWHLDDFTFVRALYDRACIMPCLRGVKQCREKADAYIATGGLKVDKQYEDLVRKAKKLSAIADTYRNDTKIKAMLNCLKSIDDPCVPMKYNQLNWDTSVLAMPDGNVIRLDEPTGKPSPDAQGFEIIENQKDFFTTQSTAVSYLEPQHISLSEKKKWKGYLDLFLPDLDYRKFVQKALGYLLVGGNPNKLAIFLVGIRNTGKTTMINTIQEALADYGATFQPNAIFKDSSTGNNPELGNLLHKRGIFSSESGSQRIHANPLKRNTGGDKVSVTRKYANDQIIGIPHFVPVVATNQAPTIDDADEALIKRIMVLPFNIQVEDGINDKRADITIPRECKHIVLHWLLIGYRNYVREGLDYDTWHPEVMAATKDFASGLSDVSTFLSETVVVAPDEIKSHLNPKTLSEHGEKLRNEWSLVTFNKLFNAYKGCLSEGQKALSDIAFGKKIRNLYGVELYQGRAGTNDNCKRWLGLKWVNEAAMDQVK